MSIANDYLDLIQRIGGRLEIPPVRAIHIAPFEADPEKSSKFGAMILTDDTVGLTQETGSETIFRTIHHRLLKSSLTRIYGKP